VFERATRHYSKPEFTISRTKVGSAMVGVKEEVVWQTPFCRLLHFKRDIDPARAAHDPRLLLVAPMSGHFATLLRGTVETFLPDHEVYITDWQDARNVALSDGHFDLDDYIDTMVDIFRFLGGDVHVFAVCQPAVPVLAATAIMEADGDPSIRRWSTRWRKSAAPIGSAATSSPTFLGLARVGAAKSIRVSYSCLAS
jgi:poly(3-hydroxybutyrate) depolymerase